MNHNNNNAIIPFIRDFAQSHPKDVIIGRHEVPSSFYSYTGHNYGDDFRNLLKHSTDLMKKNAQISENSLHVARPRMLRPGILNDQDVVVFINKTSIFNEYIINYKNKVREIIESNDLVNQFIILKDSSFDLTNCLLKTIYWTRGMGGVDKLTAALTLLASGNALFNPDCLKLYNIVLYSAPFMLIDAASGNSFSQLAFFYSPYELIASQYLSYMSTFSFEHLTLQMQAQLWLEQNLPEMIMCRKLYKSLVFVYAATKRAGLVVGITIPTVGLVRYLPLIWSTSPEGNNTSSVIVPAVSTSGELTETDIIVKILVDIILNQ